jgi:transcriptional regulator GlxA family with amidase domain
MEQHIGDRISVQDGARICALSSSHFMAFFKRATGQSFVDYLVQLRIARAQWLLAFTDKQVVAVGEEVAFCSQSYFGQVFRQRTGLSPLEYRRKARETGAANLPTDHMGKALPHLAAVN